MLFLQSKLPDILTTIAPGGRMIGREYVAGTVRGGPGDSFRFNLDKGVGGDFAEPASQGNIIHLWSYVNGLTYAEAARELEDQYNYKKGFHTEKKQAAQAKVDPKNFKLGPPPNECQSPNFKHKIHGEPSKTYAYRDANSNPIFFVARYEADSGKQFCPFSYDIRYDRWVKKQFPAPRPLYGLDQLALLPNKPVLVVEGEKAAEAAKVLVQDRYAVVTWCGGSNAYTRTDFSVLQDRPSILIWPDADAPGRKTASKLGELLHDSSPDVKIIKTDRDGGWDAADALEEGWSWEDLLKWAVPLAVKINGQTPFLTNKGDAVEHMTEPGSELCKTEHPATRIDQAQSTSNTAAQSTSNGANQHTSDVIPTSVSALIDNCHLTYTGGHGKPKIILSNEDNVAKVLEMYDKLKGIIWYDEFYDQVMTNWNTGEIRAWDEIETIQLQTLFQRYFGFHKLQLQTVERGVKFASRLDIRNEPLEWLRSLEWDQTERVESFFIDCCGSDDSEYTRAITKNFWVSMVARVIKPGCKVDNMVVLEGNQRIKKSTLLDVLGGKYYAATSEKIFSKDFVIAMQGKFIIELPELDAFDGASNGAKKRVLSTRTDRVRPHYGRHHIDRPRRSIFVGTTNNTDYLSDGTGDSRYWPLPIKHVTLNRVREIRDQLFAEAYHLYKSGHKWWNVPDIAKEIQASRQAEDPWADIIQDWLNGKVTGTFRKDEITVNDILRAALEIETPRMNSKESKRVQKVLRDVGWYPVQRSFDGQKKRIWRRAESSQPSDSGTGTTGTGAEQQSELPNFAPNHRVH